MKKLFFIVVFVLLSMVSKGQINEISLPQVDVLDLVLHYADLDSAKQLKLVGKLNGDDIKLLRNMAGADYLTGFFHEERRNKLEILDLSEARIYAGGTSYCRRSWADSPLSSKLYTKNDTIPESMFESCIGLKKIILPSTIKSIEFLSFGECTFDSIQIPENVENVICPFNGCKHLKWMSLPSTLKETCLETFYWALDSLNTVVCAATVPPVCSYDSKYPKTLDCKLIVPAGCKQKYENTTGWKQFKTIVEMESPSVVSSIKCDKDATEVARYDIDGKKLSVPQNGINIIKMSDGEIKKINVK
jgi:hypothetical protein